MVLRGKRCFPDTNERIGMARIDYGRLLQDVSIDDVAKRLGMELRAERSVSMILKHLVESVRV
jgi:hypothetical protein